MSTATTIMLGKRPETFKKTITAKLLDGSKGSMECVFKNHTITAYAAIIDRWLADSNAPAAGAPDESGDPVKAVKAVAKSLDANARYLLDVLEGWNLDAPITLENARQLSDEYPGVFSAIMLACREGINEGKLGN